MNEAAARLWVEKLAAFGVQDWLMAAGARNSPLLSVLAREDGLSKTRFVDERSMGFFGLGRAMATGRPVALITTSGTAAAELLPALMEAHYQGLRLLAVTADRPRSHSGKGTPQCVWQPGLYGVHAPTVVDWEVGESYPAGWEKAAEGAVGPSHINLRFTEPLLGGEVGHGDAAPVSIGFGVGSNRDDSPAQEILREFLAKPGPLLVVAAGIPPAEVPVVAEFLLPLQAPVVAELTANLASDVRLRPLLCEGGEKLLASWSGARVLRLGAVPSGRWWRDLENRPDFAVCSVTNVPYPGLARDSTLCQMPLAALNDVKPASLSHDVTAWQQKGAAIREETTRICLEHPLAEPALLRSVAGKVPENAMVFLGNSLPIREANLVASAFSRVRVFASRGVNGIDGQIATFFGLSAHEPESWAFLGDLTTLYDGNAFLVQGQLGPGRRRLVVFNNGGGHIFRRVGDLKNFPPEQRDWMENPHQVSFKKLSELWGWDHLRMGVGETGSWENLRDSRQLLCEVVPDEGETEAFWAAMNKLPRRRPD